LSIARLLCEAYNGRVKEFYEQMPEAVRQQFREFAAKRERVEGQCAVCGAGFVGIKKRRYCSHRCAQRAYDLKQHPGRKKRPRAPTEPTDGG
jgi:hypothetical protein